MTPTKLDRRAFLKAAGMGSGTVIASGGLAAPALAQDQPEVRWRLQSDYPRSLETVYGSATELARTVAGLTDGRFQIEVGEADQFVPGQREMLDAVRDGGLEACHTCSYYYMDLDAAFAIGTALPFGLDARMQTAWILEGGGQHLLDSFYADYGIVSFIAGNTGAQMGGWFRKEIRSLTEIAGMKMRIAGIGATVLDRLGVETQNLSGEQAYEALKIGAIDAAEWAGPADDEKLGFYKVAPYYYYPGWWDGGPSVHLFVNKGRFEALPPSYQVALRTAAAQTNQSMLVRSDILNNTAIRSLLGKGAQLRPYPDDLLRAAYKASFELYAELSGRNPRFKAIYEPWKVFRDQMYQWHRVAEYSFDSFGFAQQSKGL